MIWGGRMQINYIKVTIGTCSSSGFEPINTLDECNAAAAQIGNADTSAALILSTAMPEGCYVYGDLYLAVHASNIGNGADGFHHPICRGGAHFPLSYSTED